MKKIISTIVFVSVTTFGLANNNEPTNLPEIKKIEITNTTSEKVYFWEITTTNGVASGYTTSESLAKKTVSLMSKGSVVKSILIESYK